MPLKPEIRGLYLMATRCFVAGQYESALQYFALALRKYVRNRSEHHHNLMSDHVVLILTLNSCAVLCQMKNFADAFCLLNATFLSSLENPSYFVNTVPHQLVPLIVKIVALAYLNNATNEASITIAVKYLQLIRIHYQPFLARHMSSDEAAFIFLTEATLNSSFSAQESLNAFHAAFRLLYHTKVSPDLVPLIASHVLHFSSESKEGACSLTKDEIETIRTVISPLDFTCFLNIIGVSHAAAGRTLLAIEALERSFNLLNSEKANPIITKSVQHRHLSSYLDSCIANNLSVVYHMLDVKKTYRCHWEALSSHANRLLEELAQDDNDNSLPPIFWMIRYLSLFNLNAHSSLACDYKTARRGFATLYTRELTILDDKCAKSASNCGISFIPDLTLELLEVLAMLLAAIGKLDESWRTFLICFDEVPKAAEKINDITMKQNYLASSYTRIVDKLDRCHPPSQTNNREFEEIRRLRLQAITTDKSKSSAAIAVDSSPNKGEHKSQTAVKNERPPPPPPPAIEKSWISTSQPQNSPDDTELVIHEFKKTLQMEGSPKQGRKIRKRKKHRTLIQRVFAAIPNRLRKASPYHSSDLNINLRRKQPPTPMAQPQRIMSASYSLSDFRLLSSSQKGSYE